jgi:hypothetical protein
MREYRREGGVFSINLVFRCTSLGLECHAIGEPPNIKPGQ